MKSFSITISALIMGTAMGIPSFAAEELEVRKTFTERPKNREGHFVYPKRAFVPDDKRSWDIQYPDYAPPYYRDPSVEANTGKGQRWGEPESRVNKANLDLEGFKKFLATSNDKDIPKNPYGRTGIVGQGLLGKWGENWAADPVITRHDPKTGKLLVLLIQRTEGEWAIPGGMVDPEDSKLSLTAARELKEETGLDIKMDAAEEVYTGIVDDARNTDNSWMMTKVYHLHLDTGVSQKIDKVPLETEAPCEVRQVMWITYDDPRLQNLFASHTQFIKITLASLPEKINSFGKGE